MQPSGPNRPIELRSITTATRVTRPAPHAAPSRATHPQPTTNPISPTQISEDPARWPGGYRGDDTPDPIPNSAVKHPSAHGTAPQGAGESVAAGPPCRILSDTTPTTAGWSSPVARQAHNLKVTGSNPVPASPLTELHTSGPLPPGTGPFSCPTPTPAARSIADNSP
jgi:hypothetical protein